ncbi:MAG: hypothetical protein HYS41_03780 [Candidatus Omnitrophica bacterium]|nr:hypothetical protein [Candidatus Omnitrophota bacterium]
MIKKLGLAAALFALAGLIPWPVTFLANGICLSASALTGWHVSAKTVVWAPLRLLRGDEIKLQSPQGARVHLVGLRVEPAVSLVRAGRVGWRVRVSEIRMDPGSFGIRDRLVLELLSAGPLATGSEALLEWSFKEGFALKEFALAGSLVRARARGRFWLGREMEGTLTGDLDGRLLSGLRLMGPSTVQDWEPFSIQWVRTGAGGYGSFALKHRTFTWKTNGD